MLRKRLLDDGRKDVETGLFGPGVFLDVWAVRDLSHSALTDLRNRFAAALLAARGSLLVSAAWITELETLRGDARTRAQALFTSLGPQWLLVDARDPREVFTRDLDLPRGPDRERVWFREHSILLRGSESRALATTGAFRVVHADDLRDSGATPSTHVAASHSESLRRSWNTWSATAKPLGLCLCAFDVLGRSDTVLEEHPLQFREIRSRQRLIGSQFPNRAVALQALDAGGAVYVVTDTSGGVAGLSGAQAGNYHEYVIDSALYHLKVISCAMARPVQSRKSDNSATQSPISDSATSLADFLRASRLTRQLSQAELAAKLGLRQRQISDLERGAVDARLSTIQDVARALDLELMLIPRHLISAVEALQRAGGEGDQRPLYALDEEEETPEESHVELGDTGAAFSPDADEPPKRKGPRS